MAIAATAIAGTSMAQSALQTAHEFPISHIELCLSFLRLALLMCLGLLLSQ
jgi:hypothetical protein